MFIKICNCAGYCHSSIRITYIGKRGLHITKELIKDAALDIAKLRFIEHNYKILSIWPCTYCVDAAQYIYNVIKWKLVTESITLGSKFDRFPPAKPGVNIGVEFKFAQYYKYINAYRLYDPHVESRLVLKAKHAARTYMLKSLNNIILRLYKNNNRSRHLYSILFY